MDDRTLRRKLNQLVKLANELDDEAKRRHGDAGFLFFEAEGTFFIMSGDSDDGTAARQSHITASSDGFCRMGAGAW